MIPLLIFFLGVFDILFQLEDYVIFLSFYITWKKYNILYLSISVKFCLLILG